MVFIFGGKVEWDLEVGWLELMVNWFWDVMEKRGALGKVWMLSKLGRD